MRTCLYALNSVKTNIKFMDPLDALNPSINLNPNNQNILKKMNKRPLWALVLKNVETESGNYNSTFVQLILKYPPSRSVMEQIWR